jgi:hypothetical protein
MCGCRCVDVDVWMSMCRCVDVWKDGPEPAAARGSVCVCRVRCFIVMANGSSVEPAAPKLFLHAKWRSRSVVRCPLLCVSVKS